MTMLLSKPFVNSVVEMFSQMADIDVVIDGDIFSDTNEIVSYGVTSIITFVGTIKGRLLLDMEPSLAITFTQKITDDTYDSSRDPMVLAMISELNNVIAGDANTIINNEYKLGLRLAPPVVFVGKDTVITIPKLSSKSVNYTTAFGKLKVNIAFEGGWQ